ncbi:alcohol dehydrogenase catalytic domain-containing protein [Streptococcus macedonicus]|uniref:alcohol dehydrogenase catalytic domain-containing protein n=1 Tax=Streptococcus macedonicus TaxID=59310 RepID=UPI00215181E3|nr:alcohol dehydrogenase catalytic domain-containing protein [Streptococcus macedonicus]
MEVVIKVFALTDSSQRAISDLAIIDIPKPKIAANDVLVKMTAVGLTPVDFKVIETGVDAWTFPHIIGMDIVGEIVELGEHVTQFQIGGRVAGHGNLTKQGCLAEFASVPAYQLAKMAGLTVYTTASTAKVDFVKLFGADIVIDYKTKNVSRRIAALTDELGVDMIYQYHW